MQQTVVKVKSEREKDRDRKAKQRESEAEARETRQLKLVFAYYAKHFRSRQGESLTLRLTPSKLTTL